MKNKFFIKNYVTNIYLKPSIKSEITSQILYGERFLILLAQIFFGIFYTLLYIFFKKTAHRMIGYFVEEAVMSYSEYLAEIDNGKILNRPAPQLAIDYWDLGSEATLRDVVVAVRADEAGHRDKNHEIADNLL